MRCRAKIGAAVPDVGTPLYSGIGLSGLCLQTGEVQLSNDTNVDSRVDLKACKKLGIRSLLVLPLQANTAVLGVLELASVNANAFNPIEVARMSRLADELLRFVLEAPAIPDPGQNFAQLRTGNAIPSDIDLQEVLAAAYVIHEHGPVPQGHSPNLQTGGKKPRGEVRVNDRADGSTVAPIRTGVPHWHAVVEKRNGYYDPYDGWTALLWISY